MPVRMLLTLTLVVAGGCFRSSLVSFPPPQKVTEIRVRDLSGPEDAPDLRIDDPERIHDVLTFLNERGGKWDKLPYTPTAGRYSVSFVGQGIKLFLRTGNDTMQVQGGDYAPFFRDLSESEQKTFLSLLTIKTPPADELPEELENMAAPLPRSRTRTAAADDFNTPLDSEPQ